MGSYRQVLEKIYSLEAELPSRQYLGGMRKVLSKLGDPHMGFESIIITGTNGKGSTTAMTASALKRSGLKTGRYISPHIDRFGERICIDDREIPQKRVVELYETITKVSKQAAPVTVFEFITSMMFQYFSEENVDCAVLEVGLGGRLDATNVARSHLGAITEIGLDHTQFLGKSLASIAREKSGIIRENGAAVTAETKGEPLRAIRSFSNKKNAKLIRVGKDIHFKTLECTSSSNRYAIFGAKDTYEVSLSMLGAHQGRNAAISAALAERAGASPEAIERGISEAHLPCRLEVVSKNPKVLMDCAHNPHAAKVLAKSLDLFDYGRLILVIGMMKDKDPNGFFKELGPKSGLLVLNQPDYPRAMDLAGIFDIGKRYRPKAIGVKNVKTSLELAKKLAGPDDLICVTGSIYMLSEARGNPPSVAQ